MLAGSVGERYFRTAKFNEGHETTAVGDKSPKGAVDSLSLLAWQFATTVFFLSLLES